MEDELYKEIILHHYRNPRNKYVLRGADSMGKEVNMLCGDEITVYANTDGNGIITAVSFTGEGCAISQAAASMLTEYAKGKRVSELEQMVQQDMERLLGISLSTVRARCAMLAVKAIQKFCTL